MPPRPRAPQPGRLRALLFALLTLPTFLWPGLVLLRDLRDPALAGPGIPAHARELHASLGPRLESWARERIAARTAQGASLHDVPSTEWPLFTAVFYLLGTESLVLDWEARGRVGPSPAQRERGALEASRDLLLDPSHHAFVRTHWGRDYLHRQNVFFRSLLLAGLASYERSTRDGRVVPLLRDQTDTLAAELDASPLGLLEDYPGECYPIDVLAAWGFVQRADRVLGTDHSAAIARARRAFVGARADAQGLVPYRVELPSGALVQPARGVGMSWVLLFAPDLWGSDASRAWYDRYEARFYERRVWGEGFREWARGWHSESLWDFEVDAGPIVDGLGASASAYGIAAARRNGRFDHAWALSAELAAASWTLPGGALPWLRATSSAADAPYLGEAAALYVLTVQPAPDARAVPAGRGLPRLAWVGLFVFFGVPLLAFARCLPRRRASKSVRTPEGVTPCASC